MRRFIALAFLFTAAGVNAHYAFPWLWYNSTLSTDWQYIRMTANHYSSAPVTDPTQDAIRCYEDSTVVDANVGVVTVAAGSTLGFKANNNMGHPGYFSAYMTKASPANSDAAGKGSTWFKIWEWSPSYSASTGLVFDSENIVQFNFTIPKSLPTGQYLLRGEQIALHIAGAPQWYLACAQLNVVSGGSGSPTPTVAFPGAYKLTDAGLALNIYALPSGFTGYPAPGPAVWKG
ncbi:glycosyl hydrolase family 61-domain-containing protein [Flagelloscypha sp. PMI_526]|nr:glycosyl hydrolase family 61-domain-containing protein [Flagelloscypha sp. PMI_526]